MKRGEVIPCLTIDGKLYVEAGYLTAFCETVKRFDQLMVHAEKMALAIEEAKFSGDHKQIIESFEAFKRETH